MKAEYEKYWDRYEVSYTEMKNANILERKDYTYNPIRKSITDERYNLMRDIKGDVMYEVINTYSYWGRKTDNNYEWLLGTNYTSKNYGRTFYNDDYVLIGNCLRTFLLRGGSWANGTNAGVFASDGVYGTTGNNCGFRPVLVVE